MPDIPDSIASAKHEAEKGRENYERQNSERHNEAVGRGLNTEIEQLGP